MGILRRLGLAKGKGFVCVWHLWAGEGGRREVHCGESILGSDFHLLFICWVLFMLPAVSQSGGGCVRDWVCVGLGDCVLGTVSPSGSVQGN